MHGLVSGHSEHDTVIRMARGPITGQSSNRDTKKINDRYTEHRFRSYADSIVSHSIGFFVKAPPIWTSPLLRLTQPAELRSAVNWADAVFIESPWQFPYVHDICSDETALIYSSHNVERDLYADENWASKYVQRRIQTLEQLALNDSDLVIVASKLDKCRYRELFEFKTQVYFAPNGAPQTERLAVDDVEVPPEPVGDQFSVGFVGSDHPPNVEAVKIIIEISKQLDGVNFVVIGSVCECFDQKATPQNVHLAGFVDSLTSYYKELDLCINPVVSGSGSNVKMPEYLSHGSPVITTPFGARGVPGTPGVHYVECNVAQFSAAIKKLRHNEEKRRSLSANARHLVSSDLNWKDISEDVFSKVRTLVESLQ